MLAHSCRQRGGRNGFAVDFQGENSQHPTVGATGQQSRVVRIQRWLPGRPGLARPEKATA
jgi:hypothetical protein